MKKMRTSFSWMTLLLICWIHPVARGQDFSNKGKDFWVGYGSHCDMYNGNGTVNISGGSQEMVLYFATDSLTTVTVSIPGLGYSQTYPNIAANTVFETPPIPKTGANDARLATEGIFGRGIHISSDKPIVAYAHIYNGSRSGASLLFPTNTLGKEYYSLNMDQHSQQNNSYCYFFVVATDTGTTTIQVTPTANTQTMTAGTQYSYNLTQGQVFNALGTISGNNGVDLTGSKIVSVASGNGRCKPIAVFSGSGKINLNCPIGAGNGSADNYIVQSFPKTAWGKNFLTAPTYGMPFNYFRIAVSDPTTVVTWNGTVLSGLINNFYYQPAVTNQPNSIQADKPIMVAQYITTTGVCGNNVGIPNGDGDPEVIYLSPVEQNISKVLLYATPHFAITEHFVTVVITNSGTGVSSFRIDGAVPSSSFVVHPQNSNYSYLQQQVTAGAHTLQSDSGFNAIAYGYGSVESYGYNAGTNVRDLYQFISIRNPYATVSFPAACMNSPFYFSIVFPYEPTQIIWKFFGLFPDTTINNPVYDSTWFVNGRQLYRYPLPSPYTITSIGTFPIQVLAQNPTPDGCSGQQEINYNLQVFAPPVADFITNTVCFPNPIQFTDISNTNGRAVIHRYWDFGDASTSTANNPSHLYAAANVYNVRYSLITDVGCLSDTVQHPVTLYPLPTASITGSTSVCKDAPSPNITFTGASGTSPYIFSYTVNGGPVLTVTSTGNTATVAVPTNTAGTFVYTLISVQDGSPAACSQTQTGSATVIVNPLPSATISGTVTVCKDAPSPTIVFTGSGSTAPYIFSYTINGGSVQTVTSVGNTATVSVPTVTPGIYVYALVGVQDGSPTQCSQLQSGTATVTVNPLPFATISGSTAVCRNTTPPLVTFTGSGATAPYTFTYSINGGAPQTVVSTGNIATVPVPTGIAGSFVYTLISVQDASSTTCSQLQSGSVTVVIHPLPDPAFTVSTPRCELGSVAFTDASTPNASGLTGWYWDFGDPGSGPMNISTAQNPSHFYAAAGTYTIKLVAINSNSCVSDTLSQLLIINPKPNAGYIVPDVCLNDTYAQFTDTSQVNTPDQIVAWSWDFGDPPSGSSNFSFLQNPQHSYTGSRYLPCSIGGYF
jgi:PKD repeat protein